MAEINNREDYERRKAERIKAAKELSKDEYQRLYNNQKEHDNIIVDIHQKHNAEKKTERSNKIIVPSVNSSDTSKSENKIPASLPTPNKSHKILFSIIFIFIILIVTLLIFRIISIGFFFEFVDDMGGGSIITVLILLATIPATIAERKGGSFFFWWLFGVLLLIVALPLAIIMKGNPKVIEQKKLKEGMKKCPECAELIKPEAIKCRFCGYRFDAQVQENIQLNIN